MTKYIVACFLFLSFSVFADYRLVENSLYSTLDFNFIAPIVADDSDVPRRAGLMYYDVGVGLKIINPEGQVESISASGSSGVVSPSNDTMNMVSAFIIYTAGTPSVSRQDGNWIDGALTDNGTGDTSIPIAAGTFSQAPNCVCTAYNGGASNDVCVIDSDTPVSTSVVRTQTKVSTTGGANDAQYFIMCLGPR